MEYRYRDASEMKDSGVEWIGKIPKDWEVTRSKNLWKKEKREVKDGYGVVTAFRDGEVTLRENRRTEGFTFAIKEIGYQGVLKGDLVISAMDAFAGAMGISDSEGKCSPVYSVCSPIKKLVPQYYKYLLKEMSQKGYILSLAKGIRERSTDFRYSEFANTYLLYCIYENQEKIANFLDKKTSQFDSIISKKEALIEKLEEAKKSLISEVVTGKMKVVKTDDGYDLVKRSSDEMKDSGVEWLGEIPKDWEVNKLSNIAELTRLAGAEYTSYWETDDDGEIIALRGQNIGINELNLNNIERISSKLSNRLNRSKLYKGDIVFPCVGSIGKATLIKEDNKYHINQNIAKITHNNKIVPELLSYLLNSNECHKQITWFNSSQMQPSVLIRDLRQFKFALSYDKLEQIEICEFLELKLHYINSLLNNTRNQIQKIKEAKQSLISEVVTGKIEILD